MFKETIVTALKADAELAAAVNSTIRPIDAMQGEAKPYLCYSIVDEEDPAPSHDGPSGLTRISYDVITVATSYDECKQIAAKVRRNLKAYSGISNNTDVKWTRYQSETDIEQRPEPGAELPVFVRSQTFKAMSAESESE